MFSTPNTASNPSVTIEMTRPEAMALLNAIERDKRAHSKGQWGHYDCPPMTADVEKLLRLSLQMETRQIES